MSMKRFFIPTAFLFAAASAGAGLEKGGVTFDFKKISDERFKPAPMVSQSDNLITDADGKAPENPKNPLHWQKYSFLDPRVIAGKDPRRAQIFRMIEWRVDKGAFKLVSPAELNNILPDKAVRTIFGGWGKDVNLPDGGSGRYSITFQYRMTGPGQCRFVARGYTVPASPGWKSPLLEKLYVLSPSDAWLNYRQEIQLPRECKSLRFYWLVKGVGDMEFRKPVLTPIAAKKDGEKLSLRLSPMGYLDQTFTLARNLPGTLRLAWKRNGTPAEAKLDSPELAVILPKEITFHESAGLKLLSKKAVPEGIEYRIDLRSRRNRPAALSSYDQHAAHPLLISTASAPGTRIADGSAWVEDKGVRVSNVEKIRFKVIPSFKAAKPQYFMPGIYLGGLYASSSGPNIERCARMYDAAGVRWIVCYPSDRAAFPAWRKVGVRYITPELFFIANGFRIGRPQGRPEADQYRAVEPFRAALACYTCPAAVYEKRPFYLNTAVPYIKENLQGADGLWANWEPYGFAGKGCFCDTCRKKFAKFVGVSEEQMKKEWPRELAMGRKYYKQAVRFRSLEHAKLMLTINEAVIAATGGEKSLGFIPGVQVDTMSSTWRENGFDRETHPIDYAGKLRWVDPWGPYAFWDANAPFARKKSRNLYTFLKAKDVRQAVNKDYAPNPPKLLAFPHGLQCQEWVTQPESITIELLSFMFNQWPAATVYAFPKGYDARYWKAFADAADIAAKYDKYVFTGRRIDGRVVLTPLAPYAANTAVVDDLLGTHEFYGMLQHTAYELKDTVVVAAFNFWRDGEVFFKCQVRGLAPDTRYTVKSGGTRFIREQGSSFTGRELERGVTLHAGAVRCAVYEIAPEKAADKNLSFLTAAAVEKAREAARPALLKAKADDREYEKLYGIRESKLENISNAGITCTADKQANTLVFTAGKNKAVLFTPTLTVTDWNVGGRSVTCGNRYSGPGAVAFWRPFCRIKGGFTVTGQKKIPGGLEVTGEKRMLDRDHPDLAGLTIRQSIRFIAALSRVEVRTVLVNNTLRDLEFGMRGNFIPAPPGTEGGCVRLTAGGKLLELKRDFASHLYSTGADKGFETLIRKLFEVKSPTLGFSSGPIFFRAPGITVKLALEPRTSVIGAAVWDRVASGLAAATFEPCFKFRKLRPGGDSFAVSSTLSIEK